MARLSRPTITSTIQTATSVTIVWDPVTNAEGYQYEITGKISITGVHTNSVTITGLSPYTAYTFKVRSTARRFTESLWTSTSFTTDRITPKLSTPTLTSTSTTSKGAVINWSSVSNAMSYEWTLSPGGTSGTVAGSVNTLYGLNPNTSYTFKVRAVAEKFRQGEYLTVTFTTDRVVSTLSTPVLSYIPNPTTTGVNINWGNISNALTYIWSLSPGSQNGVVTSSNVSISSLTPSTAYTFKVRAASLLYNDSSDLTVRFTTDAANLPKLSTPSLSSTPVPSITGTTINWSNVSDATAYEWTLSPGGTSGTVGTSTKTITGLTPTTNYTFKVRAVAQTHTPGNYLTVTFTTATPTLPKLSTPTLTSTSTTSKGAVINWSSVSNAMSYEWTLSPGGTSGTVAGSVNTLYGLNPNTSYTFKVRAVAEKFRQGEYLTVTFTTDRVVSTLSTPVLSYIPNPTTTGVNINWGNISNALTYIWSLSPGSQNGVVTSSNVSISSLTPSTAYTFKVRAASLLYNDSSDLTVRFTTDAANLPKLSTPSLSSTPVPSITGTTINWSNVSDATAYEWTLSPGGTSGTVGTSTKTITGLTPTTNYTFKVRAVAQTHTPGNYLTVTFTTATPTLPKLSTPTLTSTPDPGSVSVLIDWSDISDATAYEWTLSPGGTSGTVGTSTINITGLTNATAYTFKVRAASQTHTPGNYLTVNFTTDASSLPKLSAPSNLEATYVSDTNAEIHWSYERNIIWEWILTPGIINTTSSSGTTLTNELNLSDLTKSTNYTLQVRATRTNYLPSDYSTVFSWTTTAIPRFETPSLSVDSINNESVTYRSYNFNNAIMKYDLSLPSSIDSNQVVKDRYITIIDLTPSTEYTFKVGFIPITDGTHLPSEYQTITFNTLTPTYPDKLATPTLSSEPNPNHDSVVINWDDVPPRVDYYRYSLDGVFGTVKGTVKGSSITLTGLDDDTEYVYKVKAIHEDFYPSDYLTVKFKTPLWPPLALPTISPIIPTVNTAYIDWSTVYNATGYQYEVGTVSDFSTVSSGAISLSEVTLTNLIPNTIYYFRVRAIESSLTFRPSAWTSTTFTTLAVPKLATPVLTTTPNPGIDNVSINWDDVTGATVYIWSISPAPTSGNNSGRVTTSAISFDNLIGSTKYTFIVRAEATGYTKSETLTVVFTTDTLPPKLGTPSITGTIIPDITTATINWDDVANAESYVCVLRFKGGAAIRQDEVTTTRLDLTNLRDNTVYSFSVYAKATGYTDSDTLVTSFTTDEVATLPKLTTPALTTIPTPTHNMVTIDWNPITAGLDAVFYSWSVSPGIPGENSDTVGISQLTLTGMLPSTSYTVTIIAQALNHLPSIPLEVVIVTTSLPKLSTPTLISANTTSQEAVIDWSNVSNATAYEWTLSPGGTSGTRGTSTITITGLTPTTAYTFNVRAVAQTHTPGDYLTVPFTTDAAKLSAPKDLEATHVSDTVVTIGWSKQHNDSYDIFEWELTPGIKNETSSSGTIGRRELNLSDLTKITDYKLKVRATRTNYPPSDYSTVSWTTTDIPKFDISKFNISFRYVWTTAMSMYIYSSKYQPPYYPRSDYKVDISNIKLLDNNFIKDSNDVHCWGLTPNTKYTFQVGIIPITDGTHSPSEYRTITFKTLKPTYPDKDKDKLTKPKLSSEPNPNHDSVVINLKALNMYEYSLDDGVFNGFIGDSITLTGLEEGTKYVLKVRAVSTRELQYIYYPSDYLPVKFRTLSA